MNNDNHLQHILDTNLHKREALSWLQQKDSKERLVGDMSEDLEAAASLSLRFVQDLYKRGAVKVTAIDIYFDHDIESADTLIVALPQEPSARNRIFRVANAQSGLAPTPDKGQKLLMLQLGD